MSPHLRTCWLASLGLVLAAVVSGCRTPAAQIDVTLDADACLRPRARVVRLLVWDADGGLVTDGGTVTEEIRVTAWPIRRTLVPRGGDATRGYRLEARVFDGDDSLLDTQNLAGGYVAGERSAVTLTFSGASCMDAGVMDGGALDAGLDAPPSDAAVLPGCSPGPHTRTTGSLEVLYEFREGTGTVIRNSAAGAVDGLDLVADPGEITWLPEGARIESESASARPSVLDRLVLREALSQCDSFGRMTMEAWVIPPARSLGATERMEILANSVPDTAERGGFVLGIARDEVIAAFNACDGQARPLYRFPRPAAAGPLHIVYTHDLIPFDASFETIDAAIDGGTPEQGAFGLEHAFVNGRAAALRRSGIADEQAAGCVADDAPAGLRHYGISIRPDPMGAPTGHTLSLGGQPWGGFTGTYLLLAIYCQALDESEVLENYCAGPPAP